MEQQKQLLQAQASHFKNNTKRYGLATATMGLMTGANAATTIDVTSVTTTITEGVAVVSSIGLAVLSLVVVIKVFKWARAAM